MGPILERISLPEDIKKLKPGELIALARELREYIITVASQNGGHLAPSLGVVELTLALHFVFEAPRDKIIWDVGHQAYAHKILTGRKKQFKTLRTFGGLSGFPKRDESPYDAFGVGHSSTSISAALGMALARDLKGEQFEVVAVIGDGALTGGMAFEALNHAGHLKKKLIVVVNDNEMSIAQNVGALSAYLSRIRTDPKYSRGKDELEALIKKIPHIGPTMVKIGERLKDSFKYLLVPGMLFEELGFTYLGPIDGHNIKEMIEVFSRAKTFTEPVVVHVITKKGKGYHLAEENPDGFHGVGKFYISTGEPVEVPRVSFTEIFGKALVELAQDRPEVVAITAAMPTGTGLNYFAQKYPERFYDVGIAEQHAVTLAAGMACEGLKPVVAIYSTFLQRSFDQIIHDVCLQNLPVVFAIDRAGIVGEDGPTHHGIFDLSYLRMIPNLTIMVPRNEDMLRKMLFTAINHPGPVALRYPRGAAVGVELTPYEQLPVGTAEVLKEGSDGVVIGVGRPLNYALKAAQKLENEGISLTVIDARFVKPLDYKLLEEIGSLHKPIITVEENVVAGGFGSAVNEYFAFKGIGTKVVNLGIADEFPPHGKVEEILNLYGLTEEKLYLKFREILSKL
ncbi:1-deoxy-D-xylulose-5-phosphate synthase [Carboxydothermus islandicus]|uniref:1-deoxy-D-xylulose-5-phosphate synthase n=1 Tax=Carboxydothermus islandicus TaxID=661089 RepID=A0A1L8D3K2_9THEO|nr:1-deoxy-D-xylulose-5-phosphate synthase [Carboxydothermus islandicus]GAV25651.1 1-deoxy-D-xylulose-5-phosphate synthase [Carboxydothermus islandicus]